MPNQQKDSRAGERPLITKKWLCTFFGLVSPSGYCNYQRLYTSVLTKDVLDQCGLTEEEVRTKKLKTFNAQVSERLRQALQLCVSIVLFSISTIQAQTTYIGTPYRDSISGLGLIEVVDTVDFKVIEHRNGDFVTLSLVPQYGRIVNIYDIYQVTEGIIVVNPDGLEVPRVTSVRFYFTDTCLPIDSRRVLVFKHDAQ